MDIFELINGWQFTKSIENFLLVQSPIPSTLKQPGLISLLSLIAFVSDIERKFIAAATLPTTK